MKIGRLEAVPIREVWRREERDFTGWLVENIDFLSEALGINLSVVEREARVGGHLEADILAEDPDGNYVVIENQFGKSDHDHLGKLLTYLTGLNAKTAIWICETPKPEHIKAITWLNEITPSDISFYLVKLEVFRIEDSPPAPHFTVVSGPSEESKEVGSRKKELAERHVKRHDFWKQLLERSKSITDLFANVSPSKGSSISTGAGRRGVSYVYVILKHSARIELYIDTGDIDENKRIFDELYKRRAQIEEAFGEKLEWHRLDDKRASRIAKTFKGIGWMDEDSWTKLQQKMINSMVRFEKALREHVKRI